MRHEMGESCGASLLDPLKGILCYCIERQQRGPRHNNLLTRAQVVCKEKQGSSRINATFSGELSVHWDGELEQLHRSDSGSRVTYRLIELVHEVVQESRRLTTTMMECDEPLDENKQKTASP